MLGSLSQKEEEFLDKEKLITNKDSDIKQIQKSQEISV
jgi:hypothetical protein